MPHGAPVLGISQGSEMMNEIHLLVPGTIVLISGPHMLHTSRKR
jgi:hypothetical protein